MLSLDKARDALRLDSTDNDEIIAGLLEAIPEYIEVTTGLTPAQQAGKPLVDSVTRFILMLWYNAEQTDSEKLQRTIDSLLKSLSLMAVKGRA